MATSAAEVLLDGDGPFRRQFQKIAVDVRAEGRGVVGDVATGGEAVDLEAAAVGEDRTVPGHEAMQTAQRGDEFVSGPQGEMIGIAENKANADVVELLRSETLDRGLGADGHEDGRFDDAVRGVQSAETGGAVGVQEFKADHHWT